MLTLVLLLILSPLVGAVTGLLTAHWFLFHHQPAKALTATEPADPFVSAQLDQAAATWATDKGRPEAAGLLADKLHLLYALSRRRSHP